MAPTPRPCPDGCGQLVLRARTENLRWQALNPRPDPAGNVAARIDHQDNVFARGLRKGEQPADFEQVYMPHKATCPVERARREQQARQPPASVTALSEWQRALAARSAAARNRRGRRPPPGITGVRYDPTRKG